MCQGNKLSTVYETSYPVTITDHYSNNNNQHSIMEVVMQERLNTLMAALSVTVMKEVKTLVKRATGAEEVVLPNNTNDILREAIELGEQEPYGVRGGALVVTFTDADGQKMDVGRVPLDPCPGTVQTYELELDLFQNNNIKMWVLNIGRRIRGRAVHVVIDNHFHLSKTKLYRSSSDRSSSVGSRASSFNSGTSGDKNSCKPRKSSGPSQCVQRRENLVLKSLAFSYP